MFRLCFLPSKERQSEVLDVLPLEPVVATKASCGSRACVLLWQTACPSTLGSSYPYSCVSLVGILEGARPKLLKA